MTNEMLKHKANTKQQLLQQYVFGRESVDFGLGNDYCEWNFGQ